MLIILYPIDFRIIFSKFLLQPGPPKCSFLATPLTLHNLSSNLFPRASFSSTGPTQPFKTFSSAYFIFRLKPNSITSPFGPRSKATVANIENEP